MTDRDLAGEFRAVADALLDRIEPMIASLDDPDAPHWQGCSWCPLCAAAALLRGERHELITRAGVELDSVLAVLREFLGEPPRAPDHPASPPPAGAPPATPGTGGDADSDARSTSERVHGVTSDTVPGVTSEAPARPNAPRGRYVPITVTVPVKDPGR